MAATNPIPYRALLLDLDGTLIDIDMELFIPAYIRLLAPHFSGHCTIETFAGHLLGATRVMIENIEPRTTNQATFFDDFCRRLDQPYNNVYPIFERFYELHFHQLQSLCRPRPYARCLVNTARRCGLKLALATNPLFPLAAVAHRLNWGDLSTELFDLITTVENSHFCKPRPEYYLEIAEKLGVSPAECLMAGNDVQEDLCAAAVGMDTFLVEGMILNQPKGEPEYTYRGSLEDLAKLIAGEKRAPKMR